MFNLLDRLAHKGVCSGKAATFRLQHGSFATYLRYAS